MFIAVTPIYRPFIHSQLYVCLFEIYLCVTDVQLSSASEALRPLVYNENKVNGLQAD